MVGVCACRCDMSDPFGPIRLGWTHQPHTLATWLRLCMYIHVHLPQHRPLLESVLCAILQYSATVNLRLPAHSRVNYTQSFSDPLMPHRRLCLETMMRLERARALQRYGTAPEWDWSAFRWCADTEGMTHLAHVLYHTYDFTNTSSYHVLHFLESVNDAEIVLLRCFIMPTYDIASVRGGLFEPALAVLM
jgi:hypothetical protein